MDRALPGAQDGAPRQWVLFVYLLERQVHKKGEIEAFHLLAHSAKGQDGQS